jgi:DNA-binding transcriptional regulator LsrR (DeoR family)
VRALAVALGVSRSAVHRALHKADAQGPRRDA